MNEPSPNSIGRVLDLTLDGMFRKILTIENKLDILLARQGITQPTTSKTNTSKSKVEINVEYATKKQAQALWRIETTKGIKYTGATPAELRQFLNEHLQKG